MAVVRSPVVGHRHAVPLGGWVGARRRRPHGRIISFATFPAQYQYDAARGESRGVDGKGLLRGGGRDGSVGASVARLRAGRRRWLEEDAPQRSPPQRRRWRALLRWWRNTSTTQLAVSRVASMAEASGEAAAMAALAPASLVCALVGAGGSKRMRHSARLPSGGGGERCCGVKGPDAPLEGEGSRPRSAPSARPWTTVLAWHGSLPLRAGPLRPV